MSKHRIPGPDSWEAWSPEETALVLTGCGVSWAVAGGWALDLRRGAQSRPHKDLEITICEPALPILRAHLRNYPFFAAEQGRLTPLPDRPGAPFVRQHWVLDPAASKWRMDVMVEPGDEQLWIYRRDRRVTALRAEVVAITSDGIPYLRPHVILLFKSQQQQRPVDQRDFDASMELLDDAERQWLRDALRLTAPGHHWIRRLE